MSRILGACQTKGYKVCLIGDSGTGNSDQYLVANALKNEGCDQVRVIGDVIYPSGIKSADDPLFFKNFYDPYKNILNSGVNFHINTGNHDYKNNPSAWLDLAKKYKGIKFPSLYYLETYGNVCFFNLDTSAYWVNQVFWLSDLRRMYKDKCKVAFVFGHHPRYSVGSHGEAIIADRIFLDAILPHKYDAYFSGHDHNLSDEGVIGGVHYFVTGAAGKIDPIEHPVKVWAISKLGYQTLILDYDKNNNPYFNFKFITVNADGSTNVEHTGKIQSKGL